MKRRGLTVDVAIVVSFLSMSLIAGATLSPVACKPTAVAPSIDLAACVAKEATAGKSITEIAEACAADVPAVINALVTKDELRQTPAFGEAMRTKAVLLPDGGP